MIIFQKVNAPIALFLSSVKILGVYINTQIFNDSTKMRNNMVIIWKCFTLDMVVLLIYS